MKGEIAPATDTRLLNAPVSSLPLLVERKRHRGQEDSWLLSRFPSVNEGDRVITVAIVDQAPRLYNGNLGNRLEPRTMIDEMTKRPLRISTDGVAGPYLMVLVDQLETVRTVLDRDAVRYWVDADAISLDGKPAVTVVNFGRSGDAGQIQAILDRAG